MGFFEFLSRFDTGELLLFYWSTLVFFIIVLATILGFVESRNRKQ
jgi:hypothetical protein